jgi:peptidoglycan/xylan/chitin deacetylase (PgdA/CDA1 family)
VVRRPGFVSLLRRARLAALRAASATAASRRVANSGWRNRRLLILGYHGCALDDEHLWNPDLYITKDMLRARFEALRDGGYSVVPLREGVERLRRGDLPPRSVVLTFDDGAHDFSVQVVPLLQEFGFPATVYVSTYYVTKTHPVFDTMIRYLAWKARGRVIEGAGLSPNGGPLDLREPDAPARVAREVGDFVRRTVSGGTGKEEYLQAFAAAAGLDYGALCARRVLQLMRPDEIRALPRPLVSVQLHTHRHRVPLDRESFLSEIEENRAHLESFGCPRADLIDFCYPSGITHPRFPQWLREGGVTTATTCAVALAAPDEDLLLLPRFMDGGGFSALEFEGWLTGVAQLLPRRAHWSRRLPDDA